MKAIKAIETRYAGHLMRSRMEARYAVMFDDLGVRWEYEPEGFDLPSGRYLPDFRLQLDHECWFEVKPCFEYHGGCPIPELDPRWAELVELTGLPLYVVGGMARYEKQRKMIHRELPLPAKMHDSGARVYQVEFDPSGKSELVFEPPEIIAIYGIENEDHTQQFCACVRCRAVGIEYAGMAGRLCKCTSDDKYGDSDCDRVERAYRAALSARFEYGESGARRA